MKQIYLLFILCLSFTFISNGQTLGVDTFTLGDDNSDNYGGSWGTTNQGTGFSNWIFDEANPNSGSVGRFIGSFSAALDVNGSSFGMFANNANGTVSGATISMPKTMEEGDSFTVSVGVNFRDGNKGFDLRNSSNNTIINFNVGGDQYNLTGTPGLFSNTYDANTVITFTFTQNADNVSWTAIRSGGLSGSESGTIGSISTGTITNIRFYNVSAGSNNDGGAGQRNLYLNSLNFESTYTIAENSTINVTTSETVPYLTVESGSTVNIEKTGNLEVLGNLNNSGNLTLNSDSDEYSSLIVNGTSTGNVTYNRHVNGNSTLGDTNAIGDNDLISPPVSGQTFGDFAAANPNLLENPGDATEKAFAIFDKTTGTYENYFTTTNAGTTLDAGVGYRAATNNTSTLTFTGTVNTGTVSYNIVNSGPIQADWNLIGNPYPSYVLARNFLEHEVDTGVRNVDLFQPDTAAIYGYDGDVNNNTNSYTVYNLATTLPTTVIAPGQGFLVSADPTDVAAYDVEFTPAIRTTGTDDDFIIGRGGSLINLELQLTTATDGAVTDFYFNVNASLGLDPGYDAAIFGGTAPPFSIYSLLVEDNDGTPFVIQALGDMDFGDTTVALGVNANQGEQLTFSVSTNTLPGTVEVYLDDTVASTSTLLSSGDYVLTPATELIGTGRFYLRFSDSSLSTTDNNFDDLTIYTNQTNRNIIIAGQLSASTIVNVYDIQGRLMTTQSLSNQTRLQAIDASTLNTGVYIVELTSGNIVKVQKVILK